MVFSNLLFTIDAHVQNIESTLAEYLHAAAAASIPVPPARSCTKSAHQDAGLPSSPAPVNIIRGALSGNPPAAEPARNAVSQSPTAIPPLLPPSVLWLRRRRHQFPIEGLSMTLQLSLQVLGHCPSAALPPAQLASEHLSTPQSPLPPSLPPLPTSPPALPMCRWPSRLSGRLQPRCIHGRRTGRGTAGCLAPIAGGLLRLRSPPARSPASPHPTR